MHSSSNLSLALYPSLGSPPRLSPASSSPEYTRNTSDRGDGNNPPPYSLADKVSPAGEVPSNGIVVPTPIYATWSNPLLHNPPLHHSTPPTFDFDHEQPSTPNRGFNVLDLPVQIIVQIFEKFVEHDSQPNDDDSRRHLDPHFCPADPTRIGQICSHWRTIALNGCPELWSKIHIHNPNTSHLPLVRVCIERSGNYPLDIGISHDGKDDSFDVEAAGRILIIFHSRMEYWRDINFQVPFQFLVVLRAMVKQSDKRPVRLERASMGFMGSIRNPYQPKHDSYIDSIWKFFHGSPKLKQVDWRGRGVDGFPTHAPFRQLTHVRTNFTLSVDHVLAFLAAVPRIEEISIDCIRKKSQAELELDNAFLPRPQTELDPCNPTISLQRLRVLSVHSLSIRTSSLYSRLTCPALESLKVHHNSLTFRSNQDLSQVIGFLQRSDCQLQTLSIKDPHVSDDDLERLLSSPTLRSLTSLSIQKNVVRDPIARLLMKKLDHGSHQFFPRLARLLLSSCATTDGLLAAMISSRWRYAPTLPGALRWALITPKKAFGPIDKDFFSTHELRY